MSCPQCRWTIESVGLYQFTEIIIAETLNRFNGNQRLASKALKIPKSTIHDFVKKQRVKGPPK